MAINSGIRVVWRPARSVLEQANRTDCLVSAEVKPVPGATGHADHVPCFHFDGGKRALGGMDVKQAAAMDDETYLIFIVPMLAIELGKHVLHVRSRRSDFDHVRSDVSSAFFERLYFRRVGRKNF